MLTFFSASACAQDAPPVAVKSRLFSSVANASQSKSQTVLPDYSYAGYHRCEKPLPDVDADTYRVLDVTDFGAVANDGKSDRDAILMALRKADSVRGPVMIRFPTGRFRINEKSDLGKPLIVVRRDQLVIKGSGMAETVLYADEPLLFGRSLITIVSKRPADEKKNYFRGTKRVAKVSNLPAAGGFELEVDDASQLKRGMIVNIDADLNVNTSKGKSYFKPHDVPKGVRERKGGRNDYLFELHEISDISGKTVTFAEPIHLDLPLMENVVLWAVKPFVREVGIEDLSLTGNYREQFKHHNGSRFGESYRMLRFEDAINCWARNLRIMDYSAALDVKRSVFNTFANLLLEGNPGHQSITVQMSYGNLIAWTREYADSHHGLGVTRSASGTVFLRCSQYAGGEAHCGWPRATLYDLNDGRFTPRGGGAMFFPHHGKRLCFWNWNVTTAGSHDFWPAKTPYGSFMPPIIAGLHGEPFEIPDQKTDLLVMESPGSKVSPDSLFESQLAKRLGNLPEWIAEQSRLFEEVSRHSRVLIESPESHSVWRKRSLLRVTLRLDPKMKTEHVRRTDLYASTRGSREGFRRIHSSEGFASEIEIPLKSGSQGSVSVLLATITNSRNETSMAEPIIVYLGDANDLRLVRVKAATMIPRESRERLYSQFVDLGGGEALRLKNSIMLERQSAAGLPDEEIEVDYLKELQSFYREFGQTDAKRVMENRKYIQQAGLLVDRDVATTCDGLYEDALVQFDLGRPTSICRIDIHWKDRNPRKAVRLEVQTSDDPEAWYSVVNDEPLWEFSVGRIGGTLRKEIPSGDEVTTYYFPKRRCRFVRLLLDGFRDNTVGEIKLRGPRSTGTASGK